VIKPLPRGGEGFGVREKFDRAHEEEFRKMESIAGSGARKEVRSKGREGDVLRAGKKRKSTVLGRDGEAPRRPSGTGVRSVTGMRVISNGRRKKPMVPGAFGDEEDEEDEEELKEDARGGKRVRIDTSGENVDRRVETEEEDMNQEQRQKEREAIRRKLEMKKARRRSSMGVAGKGRVSLSGKAALRESLP
jgi:hypothetical protein